MRSQLEAKSEASEEKSAKTPNGTVNFVWEYAVLHGLPQMRGKPMSPVAK